MNNIKENDAFFTVCFERTSKGSLCVEFNTNAGPVWLVGVGGVSTGGGVSLGLL
jgi:hypothetical protein